MHAKQIEENSRFHLWRLPDNLIEDSGFGASSMSDQPPKRSRQHRDDEFLQLQTARDAEEAIRNLQRTQEQLLELEQERLLAEQRRLKEERGTREALKVKVERQKETRGRMAALELEVKTFVDDLSRRALLETRVNGAPVATYRFALLQKKLAALTACKPELEDLADIRFFGELEYSIERLSSSHPEALGPLFVKAATEQLIALVRWPEQTSLMGEQTINPFRIQSEACAFAGSLPGTLEELFESYQTVGKIREALDVVRAKLSQSKLIGLAYERVWQAVHPILQVLDSSRLSKGEREFITEQSEPSVEAQLETILKLQADLSEKLLLLQEAAGVWASDKALVETALELLKQEKFGDAEMALTKVVNLLWKDIETAQVSIALENALAEVLQTVKVESGGKLRPELKATESWLERHGGSRILRQGLELHRNALLERLRARNDKIKTSLKVACGIAACVVIGKALSISVDRMSLKLSQPESPKAVAQREEIASYFREKEEADRVEKQRGETEGLPKVTVVNPQNDSNPSLAIQRPGATESVEETVSRTAVSNSGTPVNSFSGIVPAVSASPADQQADKVFFDSNFKRIPAGFFQMGEAGDAGALLHAVTVSEFFISSTEVTFQEWKDTKMWADAAGYSFEHEGAGKKPNHPVTDVSWHDVVKWCNARSERAGLRPCYYTSAARETLAVYRTGNLNLTTAMIDVAANGYRLPTEAEWEKAARGGVAGRRYPNGSALSIREANFFNVGGSTLAVKYYIPNSYGLYEMAGNVMEWCQDWYRADAYKTSPPEDPLGPDSGEGRVVRGGSWSDPKPDSCRVSFRQPSAPESASNNKGFRLVRKPSAQ